MSERLDERLRRAARTYRRLGNHTAEGMFLEAADTICELRDDLQRTHGLLDDAEHDESRAWDRARKAEAENAKLRELAAGIGHLLFSLDVDYCAGCPRDDINHPCPVYTVKGGECLYETDLRDLGVEVDG